MITEDDIITISISASTLKTVTTRAQKACIGGSSQIRDDTSRKENLFEDQLIGQIGTFALSKYLLGNGMAYLQARYVAEKFPTRGDGGEDLIGLNIDIKATKHRYPEKSPLDYHLAVRGRERHKEWIYIFALVDPDKISIKLIGWASDRDLPDQVEQSGPLRGAYCIKAKNLKPLMPIKWQY
jgi:hypothetical protein